MTSREIAHAWKIGKEAWPDVSVTCDEFADYVARLSSTAEERATQARRWADLYLACACARGDGPALEAFERAFFAEVEIAASRGGRVSPDELKQLVRHKLFVADAGE